MTFFCGREVVNLDLSVSFKTDYENLVIEVDFMRVIIEGGRETIRNDFDWFPLITNREKRIKTEMKEILFFLHLTLSTTFRRIRQRIGMSTTIEQTHPGHRWMLEALKLAQNALDKQEVPSK